jgi:nucleoside-diphosphate-sugar epimerase
MSAARVGITGASGFLGGFLASAYARDGHGVVAFARDPARVRAAGCAARTYELGAVPDLDGVDVLIHCAYAPGSRADDAVARNVEGTAALFEAARARGITFVFVSSVNAAAGVESAYARQKRAVEALLGGGALVLRPGLIAGEGGLFARLRALAARPLVPLVGGGRAPVQLIAAEDVYGALRIALGAELRGAHTLVAEPPLPLSEVLRALAGPRPPRFADVPFGLAFALATLAERLGVALPVTTENLRGLRGAAPQPASAALRALGWAPESAPAVLARLASKGGA